jgi:hypothetical protein
MGTMDEEASTGSDPPARPTAAEVASWRGAHLDESSGASAGRIEGWYEDELSGRPEWLVVRLGRFGRNVLVPARDAVGAGRRVWVPFGREVMRTAPRVGHYEALDVTSETALLAHYDLDHPMPGGRASELQDRRLGPDQLDLVAITARPGS